ncbi:MAG: Cas10/Cmr2 second palm domain-containing protein [bacterium]
MGYPYPINHTQSATQLFFCCVSALSFFYKDQFENIYTVFASGDDLFLIGPWNSIIELARYSRIKFDDYVRNENVHFSARISRHEPYTPIDVMAEKVEKEIEKSKTAGRNRLTLFSFFSFLYSFI